MAGRIRIEINERELEELLRGENGPAVRKMRQDTNRVLNGAIRRCPVDHGLLRGSLEATVEVEGTLIIGRVGSDLDYVVYVHDGTGLYGPRRRLIRPVSAKVLSWESRNARRTPAGRGQRVFAAYTRGQRPNPFLWEAIRAVYPNAVRHPSS